MTTDLQTRPEMALSVPALNIEALLTKAIETPGAVDAIERIVALRKELASDAAKAAFDEALSAFQSECPIIEKSKGVPDRNGNIAYKYAPIEHIEAKIRPLLRQHGFSHTFDTDTASAQGWVIAKCIVTHREGHSRTSVAKFPLGTKTGIMSDTQVYASALTFANRRALQNAYGLVLAGEDLDGMSGKAKMAGPSSLQPSRDDVKPLAKELWTILAPVRGAALKWDTANQWLWSREILDGAIPEEAPHLSPDRFREVIDAARKELGR